MKIGADLALKTSTGIKDFTLQHSYPSVELEDGFDKPFLHGGSIFRVEENLIARKDAYLGIDVDNLDFLQVVKVICNKDPIVISVGVSTINAFILDKTQNPANSVIFQNIPS